MRALALACVAAAAVALTMRAAPARADCDPASDVLYIRDVFLPYDEVAKPPASALLVERAVTAAKRAGYPVRVALIASPYDLGTASGLFGKPQAYAHFLGLELRLVFNGRLLVVMPAGFGIYHGGAPTAAEQRLLAGLAVGAGTEGLNRAAALAVLRLAGAAGHVLPVTVPGVPAPASTGGGWSDRYTIAAAAGGLALLLAASRLPPLRRLLRRR